jgi:hypothetical protein
MRCRRKWNWSYLQNLSPSSYNSNLSVGSAVHNALQSYYKGDVWQYALEAYWLPIYDSMSSEDIMMGQLIKDSELSYIMMEGYMEWLNESSADANLKPVLIEEKVEMEILPGVILHGTLDLVQEDGNHNLWLTDHKTTAAFGALVDRRLQLNFQLLTYAVLCREHYGDRAPLGAKLNMLRKVKRTASAKPPFYARETVYFNITQLNNHVKQMQAITRDLLRTEEAIAAGDNTVAYPVVDQDCSWKCPFLSVCAFADDGSDISGALNELYVQRDRS